MCLTVLKALARKIAGPFYNPLAPKFKPVKKWQASSLADPKSKLYKSIVGQGVSVTKLKNGSYELADKNNPQAWAEITKSGSGLVKVEYNRNVDYQTSPVSDAAQRVFGADPPSAKS